MSNFFVLNSLAKSYLNSVVHNMYVIKARTHVCVRNDSETHSTGVTGLHSQSRAFHCHFAHTRAFSLYNKSRGIYHKGYIYIHIYIYMYTYMIRPFDQLRPNDASAVQLMACFLSPVFSATFHTNEQTSMTWLAIKQCTWKGVLFPLGNVNARSCNMGR